MRARAGPPVTPVPPARGPDKSSGRISGMFDAIAPHYDLLNRVLSAGIDRRWRARAIASLELTGHEVVLDVCTGTADVALQARRDGAARVIGVDFAGAMLRLGLDKIRSAGHSGRIVLIRGDATNLPVHDASVDAATVAFGIRNVERTDAGCRELARALKPGGRLAILEFGVPTLPGLRQLYQWYFRYLLPTVGRLVSGHGSAYTYLPQSVGAFPSPPDFVTLLRQSGFSDVGAVPLTFGIVYLYTARRAP